MTGVRYGSAHKSHPPAAKPLGQQSRQGWWPTVDGDLSAIHWVVVPKPRRSVPPRSPRLLQSSPRNCASMGQRCRDVSSLLLEGGWTQSSRSDRSDGDGANHHGRADGLIHGRSAGIPSVTAAKERPARDDGQSGVHAESPT